MHQTSIPGSKCLRHENCWEHSDHETQWCQDKLRLPCVYRCEHTQRSKQSHDSTYCGSCRNRLIVYLYSQHTDALLLALRREPQLGTNFIAFLPSSELYLLHWLDLQKERNSPLKWSSAVKSPCAHHYVLRGSTLPMWKTSGGTFHITETWKRIKQTPTYPWCIVATYKASTYACECLITGCSLRPNHSQISGAWIAPAWWPIVVQTKETPAPEFSTGSVFSWRNAAVH